MFPNLNLNPTSTDCKKIFPGKTYLTLCLDQQIYCKSFSELARLNHHHTQYYLSVQISKTDIYLYYLKSILFFC